MATIYVFNTAGAKVQLAGQTVHSSYLTFPDSCGLAPGFRIEYTDFAQLITFVNTYLNFQVPSWYK